MPMEGIKKKATKATKDTVGFTAEAADTIEKSVENTVKGVDSRIAPLRENVLRRFPVLFSLLVTFGLVTTLLGIERILLQYEVLNQHPWYILFIGVVTLSLTGTLYKNLNKK